MRRTLVILAAMATLTLGCVQARAGGARLERGRSARLLGKDLTGPVVVEFATSRTMKGRYYVDVKMRHQGRHFHLRWWGTTSYDNARAFAKTFVAAMKNKRLVWVDVIEMFDTSKQGYNYTHAELKAWEERF